LPVLRPLVLEMDRNGGSVITYLKNRENILFPHFHSLFCIY
jgi:hypothetical protein